MTCKYKKADGTTATTTVKWKVFFPTCPKINVNNLCNAKAGAYVAAATVCRMRLF